MRAFSCIYTLTSSVTITHHTLNILELEGLRSISVKTLSGPDKATRQTEADQSKSSVHALNFSTTSALPPLVRLITSPSVQSPLAMTCWDRFGSNSAVKKFWYHICISSSSRLENGLARLQESQMHFPRKKHLSDLSVNCLMQISPSQSARGPGQLHRAHRSALNLSELSELSELFQNPFGPNRLNPGLESRLTVASWPLTTHTHCAG